MTREARTSRSARRGAWGVACLALLVAGASGCKTRLGIVTENEAFAGEIEQRRIVLESRRVPLDEPTPPIEGPAIWYVLGTVDEPSFDTRSPTIEFLLSFLAENDSSESWTLSQTDFELSAVDDGRGRRAARQRNGGSADDGDTSGNVLLTLPPGGAATLRVPFAVTAGGDLTRGDLLGTVWEVRVLHASDALLLRRRVELGEWDQIWQGARTALLATFVFLLWGALA